jgi:signal recognition particle subunit SRP54
MFNSLAEKLNYTLNKLTGQGRISEKNITDTLKEIREALIDADVAITVVKHLLTDIKKRALGHEVLRSLSPGQTLIKIIHDELILVMGEKNKTLDLSAQPPAVILLAGLQGSGKTTSAAKLAKFLQEEHKKKVLLASVDVYRPAAIQQLETLASQIGAEFYPSDAKQDPVKIAKEAMQSAKQKGFDVLLIDTAGRLHIDQDMMREIQQLHQAVSPVETLFVVDSMTGQDAAKTAQAFHEALPLTGVILTKTDGDARGGAALSVRYLTGKPIKFIGVGEKIDALAPFYPERIVSRILGRGDIVSLVESVQRTVDQEKAAKIAKKIQKGRGFDLEDFKSQLQEMKKMGGLTEMLDKLPGVGAVPQAMKDKMLGDKSLIRFEAMINSMTLRERHFPDIINGSRKRRIAQGSGTTIQDINQLLKQFTHMQKMFKKMSKGGLSKMMRQFGGNLPGGLGGLMGQ